MILELSIVNQIKNKKLYKMKTTILTLAFALLSASLFAQVNPNYHQVSGYYKSNGTYVAPHYQTNPNSTINDNYSTYPNVNPWTGKQGTVTPDYSTPSYNYSTTPSYNYNTTPSYNYNTTPSYNYNTTPSYNYNTTPSYNYSYPSPTYSPTYTSH